VDGYFAGGGWVEGAELVGEGVDAGESDFIQKQL